MHSSMHQVLYSPCVIASVAAGVACADELMREAGCEVVATAAEATPVAPFSSVPLASPRSTRRCRRTRIFSSFCKGKFIKSMFIKQ